MITRKQRYQHSPRFQRNNQITEWQETDQSRLKPIVISSENRAVGYMGNRGLPQYQMPEKKSLGYISGY